MEESNLCAIVTTLKGAGNTVESWIYYHLTIGFDHLFLFFDDSSDSSIPLCSQFDQSKISVILCDETLHSEQKKLEFYTSMSAYLKDEVQARQQLNAMTALERCKSMGITWLLHIDIDELFYCTKDLKEHLANLRNLNIGTLTYANYEAVPEFFDTDDFFCTCTLFKKHLSATRLNPERMKVLNFWQQRTPHNQYFLAYDVGKSIVRVMDDVVPDGVHNWKLPKSKTSLMGCTAITDARNLDLSRLFKCEEVAILHYVVCGFHWWYKKYEILDVFPNFWFGGQLKIAPCFHLDSRNVYLSGDVEKMKKFYRSSVLVMDEQQIINQIESGLCLRINTPSEIIKTKYPQKGINDPEGWGVIVKESMEQRVPKDGPSSTVNTLSLEKMWMISSLVGEYLNQDFYGNHNKK